MAVWFPASVTQYWCNWWRVNFRNYYEWLYLNTNKIIKDVLQPQIFNPVYILIKIYSVCGQCKSISPSHAFQTLAISLKTPARVTKVHFFCKKNPFLHLRLLNDLGKHFRGGGIDNASLQAVSFGSEGTVLAYGVNKFLYLKVLVAHCWLYIFKLPSSQVTQQ